MSFYVSHLCDNPIESKIEDVSLEMRRIVNLLGNYDKKISECKKELKCYGTDNYIASLNLRDLERLIIKYIKAFNLINEFHLLKLDHIYEFKKCTISPGDYRNSVRYVYSHKKEYHFNTNSIKCKVNILDNKDKIFKENLPSKIVENESGYSLLTSLIYDFPKNRTLLSVFLDALNIDVRKLHLENDKKFDEILNIQDQISEVKDDYIRLSLEKEKLIDKLDKSSNHDNQKIK